jgi:hypothetical protein
VTVSSMLYRAARLSRDANAVNRALKTRSPRPIVRRAANRMIGRAAGRVLRRLYL